MGTIDTFRDLVGNIADDAKKAFDELLDRRCDDWDGDYWDDPWDCDPWDWDDRPVDDWRRGDRRTGNRRGDYRRRGQRRGSPRVVEAGRSHPAVAEPRRSPEDGLPDQIRQLNDSVDSLRASLQQAPGPAAPEHRT
ncbi:hypothetical protein [Saccharopolyspora sp. SCSIO 74807]|uniref:hypothetical protein n=1 Tax=Saccharopolyspora sp. SCSIO 74807 TaxID=3118084 RepID=UPI0030D465BF